MLKYDFGAITFDRNQGLSKYFSGSRSRPFKIPGPEKTPRSGRIRIRNPVKICSTQGASQGVILLGEGGGGLAGWVKSQSGRFVTPHQNVKGWRGRVIFNKLRLGKKFGFAPHRPKKKMNI